MTKVFEIFYSDLTPKAQRQFLAFYGEKPDFTQPLAKIEVEDDEIVDSEPISNSDIDSLFDM